MGMGKCLLQSRRLLLASGPGILQGGGFPVPTPQEDRLVELFRRECRKVSAGLADAAGLPGRLWYHLGDRPRVRPEVVARLWAHVPAGARDGFAAAVREAASPEFRLPLWIREYRPMTLAELEADADLRSDRVRAWAAEFCRVLTME
jgi:hypothetical protein